MYPSTSTVKINLMERLDVSPTKNMEKKRSVGSTKLQQKISDLINNELEHNSESFYTDFEGIKRSSTPKTQKEPKLELHSPNAKLEQIRTKASQSSRIFTSENTICKSNRDKNESGLSQTINTESWFPLSSPEKRLWNTLHSSIDLGDNPASVKSENFSDKSVDVSENHSFDFSGFKNKKNRKKDTSISSYATYDNTDSNEEVKCKKKKRKFDQNSNAENVDNSVVESNKTNEKKENSKKKKSNHQEKNTNYASSMSSDANNILDLDESLSVKSEKSEKNKKKSKVKRESFTDYSDSQECFYSKKKKNKHQRESTNQDSSVYFNKNTVLDKSLDTDCDNINSGKSLEGKKKSKVKRESFTDYSDSQEFFHSKKKKNKHQGESTTQDSSVFSNKNTVLDKSLNSECDNINTGKSLEGKKKSKVKRESFTDYSDSQELFHPKKKKNKNKDQLLISSNDLWISDTNKILDKSFESSNHNRLNSVESVESKKKSKVKRESLTDYSDSQEFFYSKKKKKKSKYQVDSTSEDSVCDASEILDRSCNDSNHHYVNSEESMKPKKSKSRHESYTDCSDSSQITKKKHKHQKDDTNYDPCGSSATVIKSCEPQVLHMKKKKFQADEVGTESTNQLSGDSSKNNDIIKSKKKKAKHESVDENIGVNYKKKKSKNRDETESDQKVNKEKTNIDTSHFNSKGKEPKRVQIKKFLSESQLQNYNWRNRDDDILETDDSDSKLKITVSDKIKDLKENSALSKEDIEKFSNLEVLLPWAVPALHLIETRIADRPTALQRETMEALGVPIKMGPFSAEEDKQIKKNWKHFWKLHDLTKDPQPFLSFKQTEHIFKSEERIKFVRFLARGLDDRMLCSVYQRFRRLFLKNKLKSGRFTAKEDKIIVDFIKTTSSKTPFADLGKLLNRDKLAVEKRCSTLVDQFKGTAKSFKWVPKNIQEFMKHLVHVLKIDDVEVLRNREITAKEWAEMAKRLGVHTHKLRNGWLCTIYPKLFTERKINTAVVRKDLISLLIRRGENDWRAVNWDSVAKEFNETTGGFTGKKLLKMMKHMVWYHVDAEKRNNLGECLKFLDSIKGVKIKSQGLKRLKIVDKRKTHMEVTNVVE